MSNASAAPTGCYKCGLPGHWSRDCPSSAPVSNSNPNPSSAANPTTNSANPSFRPSGNSFGKAPEKVVEKPKKAQRTRPKLTPELLLSNDGLGYVLRHFPRAFKYRGRGYEVEDLGNLIGMYSDWHKRLLPYYSFDQFVHKVEQVGATRRVKMTIRDLREKVLNGGDPTKLHELACGHDNNREQETVDMEEPRQDRDPPFEDHDDTMEESMFDKIFEKEASQIPETDMVGGSAGTEADGWSKENQTERAQASSQGTSNNTPANGNEMTGEQKARMIANRLKALEKAAARKAAAAAAANPSA